jgi:cytoskeletal protein RodZ
MYPNNPPVGPEMASAQWAAQQAVFIQQQVDSQIARYSKQYDEKLSEDVKRLSEELKKKAASQLRSVVIAGVGAIVAGFAVLVYVQTRSLNDNVIAFQTTVMSLQKEVLATSNDIGVKASVIAAANKELETVTHQVESARASLETATKELQQGTQRLAATASEYEKRLKRLDAAGTKSP